jgi:hypothetical protein
MIRSSALVALLALMGLVHTSAAMGAAPAFCQDRLLRDDERPLDRMPPQSPPPKGELPFGPRNLSIYALNFGARVVLDGSHLGYRFAAKEDGERVLALNWDVRAKLQEVDSRGRPIGTAGSINRRLGKNEDLDLLQFSFPASEPGLYRLDISFDNLRGKRLASFSEHFRVVPRREKVRVAVSKPAFRPGEIAYARILNLGTVGAQMRPGLVVERLERETWVRQAEPPVSKRSIEKFRWTLFGAEASPCAAFPIPADAKPGLYRFMAKGLVFGPAVERQTFTAPFRVRAEGS